MNARSVATSQRCATLRVGKSLRKAGPSRLAPCPRAVQVSRDANASNGSLPDEAKPFERRTMLSLLAGMCAFTALPQLVEAQEITSADPIVTNKVYLDVAMAPTAFKLDRTIGDKNVMPVDTAEPVGRLVIGLYGNVAPTTVANFLTLIRSGNLINTAFSRVLPGEYIMAGQQGSKRMGQLQAPADGLLSNKDTTTSSAFQLTHSRPGTVSLAMTENDEDPSLRDDVPTFKPLGKTIASLNAFASSIGDDRAVGVRRKYGKPLKAVLITGCGELPVGDADMS
eukprot:gene19393-26042_t